MIYYQDLEDFTFNKVYVVKAKWEGNSDRNIYTISPFPNIEAWETDSGCDGYGLPKKLAEIYADAINLFLKENGKIKFNSSDRSFNLMR